MNDDSADAKGKKKTRLDEARSEEGESISVGVANAAKHTLDDNLSASATPMVLKPNPNSGCHADNNANVTGLRETSSQLAKRKMDRFRQLR